MGVTHHTGTVTAFAIHMYRNESIDALFAFGFFVWYENFVTSIYKI
jgi:hypothetical protein